MEEFFIQYQIPGAKILDCNVGKGIRCYQSEHVIYIVANTDLKGLITEKIKENAIKELNLLDKQLVFVSIFNKRADCISTILKIAWGSFLWFADGPKHTIHFDDDPKELTPYFAKPHTTISNKS